VTQSGVFCTVEVKHHLASHYSVTVTFRLAFPSQQVSEDRHLTAIHWGTARFLSPGVGNLSKLMMRRAHLVRRMACIKRPACGARGRYALAIAREPLSSRSLSSFPAARRDVNTEKPTSLLHHSEPRTFSNLASSLPKWRPLQQTYRMAIVLPLP
jgi:hypothetical protein